MFLKALILVGMLSAIGYSVGWPVFKVVKNELATLRPYPMKLENLAYRAESVSFQTDDDLKIAGSYAPSKNGATIVLLHGFGESRKQLEGLGKLLTEQGYGVLSYDTRAHGESEGSITGCGDKETLDLKAALDFLQIHGVSRYKIGAYGFSIGAFTLARLAAHDDRLQSVILASPPSTIEDLAVDSDGGGIKGWVSGQLRLIIDEFHGESAYGLSILEGVKYISPRPVLIIGGENDQAVPPKRLREIYAEAQEPKSLVIFEGASHGDYAAKEKERFERIVLDFFQKTLLKDSHKS